MAFNTEQFIIDLARQLNLNNMDDATRARLEDLQKKGVATKQQQGWEPGDATDPKLPKYDANDGATPPNYAYDFDDTLTAPQQNLKTLYLKLVVILRDVAADKELKSNEKVQEFLNEFYGTGKAVEEFAAKKIPDTYNVTDIANYIKDNRTQLAFALELKESDLSTLHDALNDGSYTTNAKALNTLENFLSKLSTFLYNNDATKLPGSPPTELTDTDIIGKIYQEVSTPTDPTDDQTRQLRDGAGDLFSKLIADEKLREKVLAKDTDGDITKWINKGLDKSNYKTGDHALAPKYKDRKQFWDDAKKKVNDWYTDTLGKLESKHKRHIYQTNARYIVDELIKKGVKPTDGTGKILETLDAIRGELPNPVQKQMDWIKNTLKPMSKMSFFKDALRDGDQMNTLVSEIIKAAAHDDKEKEAMVALEMLAVMRYTLTTSSVRDQLQKTEFKLLSDPNLSFNKGNSFMQSFTGAIDKTLKFGMMAAFEVGNLAKNAIKQQGLKYGKGEDSLNSRITKSVQYQAGGDKQKMMEKLFGFWNIVNTSANTKDYNIVKSHKKVQEAADNKVAGTVNVTLAGVPTDLEYKTEQERRYLEYLRANNIGRAA